jgi:hypothetical protein
MLARDMAYRGGFGSGIGQNRCLSVEIRITDNPSVNHPLIGTGWTGRLGDRTGWLVGFRGLDG